MFNIRVVISVNSFFMIFFIGFIVLVYYCGCNDNGGFCKVVICFLKVRI